jgi:hypothetical protein
MELLEHISLVENVIIQQLSTFAETAEKNIKTVSDPMHYYLISRMASLVK